MIRPIVMLWPRNDAVEHAGLRALIMEKKVYGLPRNMVGIWGEVVSWLLYWRMEISRKLYVAGFYG